MNFPRKYLVLACFAFSIGCFAESIDSNEDLKLVESVLNKLIRVGSSWVVSEALKSDSIGLYSSEDSETAFQCFEKETDFYFSIFRNKRKGKTYRYKVESRNIKEVEWDIEAKKGVINLFYSERGMLERMEMSFCSHKFGFELSEDREVRFLGWYETLLM